MHIMQILNDDTLFFGLFLVIFIAGWIVRGYYESKSPDARKSLAELKRQPLEYESRQSMALLSMYGLLLLAGVVVYIFYRRSLSWTQLPLMPILRWVGVVVGIICLPLIAWVQSTLGVSFSKTLTIQEGQKLVKTGPYSRIRHPMYSVFTLWFLSWFIVSTNLLFAISWIFWVAYIVIRIPQEEEMLIEKFGDEYREYMKNTGRLLPRI